MGTGKIADIRYGGERRAGRGYRDLRRGTETAKREGEIDLVELEI